MAIYEVVGDVDGDVMGDVMGEYEEVGAAPARHPQGHWRNAGTNRAQLQRRGGGQNVVIAKRPEWRDGQAAPGVMLPDEGMVPLGMEPDNGTGIFTAAGATKITWKGQLQKPFRAERLLVSVVRAGTTAVGRLLGQFFVGVDLNMGAIAGVDIETIGSPTAFGTRMTMLQAPPGVIISIPTNLSSGLTSPDTIFASIMWTGRIIH